METSKRNQIKCGLDAKFGPNYVHVVKKSKATGNIIRVFFHILLWEYLSKQKVVVIKPAEYKCVVIIVIEVPNFKDVRAKYLSHLGRKWQKSDILFNNFTLVSRKVTKMLFKIFLIWVFRGQNVGPGWVKNGKKGFFHTSHLSANPVLPKNEVLNNHSVLTL